MPLHSSIIGSIAEVCNQDWDALGGTEQPFLSHAFLNTLERHECVGKRWGWLPRHTGIHGGTWRTQAISAKLLTRQL